VPTQTAAGTRAGTTMTVRVTGRIVIVGITAGRGTIMMPVIITTCTTVTVRLSESRQARPGGPGRQ
jgi:hypothetical protein